MRLVNTPQMHSSTTGTGASPVSVDLREPGAWRRLAACAGEHGEAFYPPLRPEKRSAKAAREQRAKAVCAGCTVREQCLEQALDQGERYGIWGGLTDGERSHLRAS